MKGTKLQPAAVRRSRRDEHRRISHWVDCTPLQRTWLFPKITNRSAVAITSGNRSDLRKLSRKSAGPERLVSAGNEGFAQACWNLVAGWHGFRRRLASNLNRSCLPKVRTGGETDVRTLGLALLAAPDHSYKN